MVEKKTGAAWLMSLACAAALEAGQVATDGSLGRSSNIGGPAFKIPASLGSVKGSNLYHSFDRFDLAKGDVAMFSGPKSVQNVIARVTGGKSSIDGTIRSEIPHANFYLINPAGVFFGPNAALDVGGSFNVTTASYLRMADGSRFSATAPPSALSTAAPVSFGFLSTARSAVISVGDASGASGSLRVGNGQSVRLVGGSVEIKNASITASGGNIHVAAATAGEIAVDTGLPASPDSVGGAISIDHSTLNVSHDGVSGGAGGGKVSLSGSAITLQTSSVLSRTVDGTSLGISVQASGPFQILQSSMDASSSGYGTGGTIAVKTPHLVLKDASILSQATESLTGAANMRVSVDITSDDSGIGLYLESPSHMVVGLISMLLDEGTNFSGTTFDDRANSGIGAAIDAPLGYPGVYLPQGSGRVNPDNYSKAADPGVYITNTLSTFVGQSTSGDWKLIVLNVAETDATLNRWSLDFNKHVFTQNTPLSIPTRGQKVSRKVSTLHISKDMPIIGNAVPGAGKILLSATRADERGDSLISAASLNGPRAGIVSQNIKKAFKDGSPATLEIDTNRQAWFTAVDRVVPDGTLSNTTSFPSVAISNGKHVGKEISITGGTQVGDNQYYSVTSFDLGRYDLATFDAASGGTQPKNIFVRVTGGRSFINGTIDSSINDANIYLINPAGITLAADATLGSTQAFAFVGTTADYLGFGSALRFDSKASPRDAALPAGAAQTFGFTSAHPQGLSVLEGVRSQTLQAAISDGETNGKSISFVAGGIKIQGFTGKVLSNVTAERVNLVSVGSPGTVTLSPEYESNAPLLSGFSMLGPINLVEGGTVLGAGRTTGGTSVYSDSANLTMYRGGSIFSGDRSSDPALAGDIVVHAKDVLINGHDDLENTGLDTEYGDIQLQPHITVEANSLHIVEGGIIAAKSFGTAPAGIVDISVKKEMVMDGSKFGDYLFTGIKDDGDSGTIGGLVRIRADSLTIMRNARIRSTSFDGSAPAGSIDIQTVHDFIDDARPFQTRLPQPGGQAVPPQFDATTTDVIRNTFKDVGSDHDTLIGIEDPSVTTTAKNSAGGNISIRSTQGSILVEGTSIYVDDPNRQFATIDAQAKGDANITLQAARGITVSDAPISARALNGDGGNIRLDAFDSDVILTHATIDGRHLTNSEPVKVIINADNLIKSTDSQILSDAITAPVDLNIAGSIINLAGAISRPELKLQDACRQFTLGKSYSSFTVEGANGVPIDPEAWTPALSGAESNYDLAAPAEKTNR